MNIYSLKIFFCVIIYVKDKFHVNYYKFRKTNNHYIKLHMFLCNRAFESFKKYNQYLKGLVIYFYIKLQADMT